MINLKKLKHLPFSSLVKSFALLSVVLVTACDSKPSLKTLCAENKAICDDLSADNWCKKERNTIITTRIDLKNNNLDGDKYKLLVGYEGYVKCMALASQIQHIKQKEKTIRRKDNLFKAQQNLAELAIETANSKHPHLLFYQWSRESNEEALAEFLAMEGTQELENSTAQFHLASYYIKRDTKKAMGLLYHALELHDPETEISAEILQTLATLYIQQEKYKQGYIWLRTYQLVQQKTDKQLSVHLQNYQQRFDLDTEFLDEVAQVTLNKIKEGSFTSPKF